MKITSRTLLLATATVPALLLAQACSDDPDPLPTTSSSATSSSSSTSTSSSSTSSSSSGGEGGAGGGAGGAGGSGGAGGAMMAAPDLDTNLVWYTQVREKLDAMIDAKGVNSATYDPTNKPVAIFDWDNTVIKNDVGDLTMFWLLNNDKIRQPPLKNWATTSAYLTPAAVTALNTACDAAAAAGQPLPTSTNTACANEIFSVYYNSKTTGTMDAFAGWNRRHIEPAYAWLAQLLAGYTPGQISGFAQSAIDAGLAANIGDTQMVGTNTGVNAYVRIYDQIKDLIDVTQKNGFDVWVVSASPQSIVEPFAAMVNVAADHVIGIRTIVENGKLTSNIQGCGPVVDGTNDGMGGVTGNSLITYIDGKRCWINKVIFGDTTASALNQNADPSKRIVFGAGDSDTDVSFLRDATALKLVLNRNKAELMCNAYNNYMMTWLINPMFIAPKGMQAAPYPCTTTACKDMNGVGVPCLDEGGMAIANQNDTVFP